MIIFLDIDGVMVPAKSWQRPVILNDGFPEFSAIAVNALKTIIDNETTILLTTSHKARFSIDEWKSIFEKRNIRIGNIDKLEDNVERLNRKQEIEKWFQKTNIHPEKFIIIDDDKSLNDLPLTLKKHLILTSPTIGLTESYLGEMREILGLQSPVEV